LNFYSTRVSNELGAGQPERAKHAMGVTLKLSLLLGFCFVLMLLFGHNIWIQLFSNSPIMKKKFASITPLLAISILLDSVQGVLSGLNSFSFNLSFLYNIIVNKNS
jgi:MATE family multidrug resistance protein